MTTVDNTQQPLPTPPAFPKAYIIPEGVLTSVGQYLASRPWGEVTHLMQALSGLPAYIPPTVENKTDEQLPTV